jgi:diguanylate cyclase (GGDEF)-like protein
MQFRILDPSNQLDVDLEAPCGVLGRAVVFCDLDNFKALNTRFTETGVDRSILPRVHRLLADCAEGHARAYCVGGDEFAFLLSNASMGMVQAFAEEVRIEISKLQLEMAKDVQLSASVGVAHSAASKNSPLREHANIATRRAKDGGKNCVVMWTP